MAPPKPPGYTHTPHSHETLTDTDLGHHSGGSTFRPHPRSEHLELKVERSGLRVSRRKSIEGTGVRGVRGELALRAQPGRRGAWRQGGRGARG